jgi:hypothetical protein
MVPGWMVFLFSSPWRKLVGTSPGDAVGRCRAICPDRMPARPGTLWEIRVDSKQELIELIHLYFQEVNAAPVVFRRKYKNG